MRIGIGFDAHRFGAAEVETVRIGGVDVPFDREILAHSDGDVILHALCDAMLGALALGDLGKFFPDSDPQYHNIDSRLLLRATMEKIGERNYHVVNVDITLIAEEPKVAEYVDAMRGCIAENLVVDVGVVGLKATTTEKMGFIGRGEGLTAQAVVLLDENVG